MAHFVLHGLMAHFVLHGLMAHFVLHGLMAHFVLHGLMAHFVQPAGVLLPWKIIGWTLLWTRTVPTPV